MKTLITILILIAILCIGCEEEEGILGVLPDILPDSVGLGVMFINIETRAGDIKGATPMVFGIWNRDK